MRYVIAVCLSLCAMPLVAQDTQFDGIRSDLATLRAELERLRSDAQAQGGTGSFTGSTLDRLNLLESELQRLTGTLEQLEFRVGQVVRDGTNRIGDLEFRVCEADPSCDIGQLGQTAPLGGVTEPQAPAAPAPSGGPELAVGEQSDFGRAQEALANGDFRSAATLFEAFGQTYPGSPLEPQAILGRGAALEALGDTREAARAFLTVYSSYPDSPVAPKALTRLGISLGLLDKVAEACVTLAEVEVRYPGSQEVREARDAMVGLGCS